jgi:hypothetical protein
MTALVGRSLLVNGLAVGELVSLMGLCWVHLNRDKTRLMLKSSLSQKDYKMNQELTIEEATFLAKIADKKVEEFKKAGKSLQPGAYTVDISLKTSGFVSKDDDKQQKVSFKSEDVIRGVILHYAKSLGVKEGAQWLEALTACLPSVSKVIATEGFGAIEATIPEKLRKIFDDGMTKANEAHKENARMTSKAGNTMVNLQTLVLNPEVVKVSKKRG